MSVGLTCCVTCARLRVIDACESLITGESLIICQVIQQSIMHNTNTLAPALHSSFSPPAASSPTYLRKVPSPLHMKHMKYRLIRFRNA
jgi:hypothetical protein